MLLDGTDLSSAFQPLHEAVETPYMMAAAAASAAPVAPAAPSPPAMAPPPAAPALDYNNEQRLMKVIQDLKQTREQSPSYVDKLLNKKKDLFKILQLALIITLALALHFVIKHYLKCYINNNDFSCERQLLLRLLYPLAILFIIWNMKVFIR